MTYCRVGTYCGVKGKENGPSQVDSGVARINHPATLQVAMTSKWQEVSKIHHSHCKTE